MDLSNKRVLFLGDSITHDGQYVGFIEYALRKQKPDQNFDFYSLGLNSETASGLSENDHPFPRPCIHERLGSALDKIKPEVVFVCYGMNDGIYHPLNKDIFDAYKKGMLELVKKCQNVGAEVILITPPLFQAHAIPNLLQDAEAADFSYRAPYKAYQETLAAFSEWTSTATPENVTCVNLNSIMATYVSDQRKENKNFCFSKDGIHPSLEGHLFIAQIILKTLNFNHEVLSLGKLTELKKLPLYKLVEKRRQLRSRGWLKYVGYERAKVFKTDSISETELRVAELLKEIDAIN